MESYSIGAWRSPKGRVAADLRRFFELSSAYAVVRLLGERLWPGPKPSSVVSTLAASAAWAVFFMIATNWIGERSGLFYDLVVTDEAITAEYAVACKTVHRGRVRTIAEQGRWASTRPGIIVSERGELATWFWGGVFIPKDLPAYDRLRQIVYGWQHDRLSTIEPRA